MSQAVELRKLAEEYLGSLLVQGYSSINTASIKRYLERFINHISAEGKDLFIADRTDPRCVDHGCLLRWLQAIRLTGVKEYSLQANKTSISGFYRWLIRVGRADRNPIEMLAPIKLPKYLPKPIPVGDTEKVLLEAKKMPWINKVRNKAMLEVFYASGIRNSELASLDINDVVLDAPEPYVMIRAGKGKKDGLGMLTPAAVEAIKAYLPIREKMIRKWEKPKDWPPLFLSKSGKRMDKVSIWQIVGEVGQAVLGRHIHPHQFRHSFCTDLLNRGADLMSIKELARHEQLTTTQKYLAVSTERLKEQYAKHPGMKPKGEEPKK